MEQDGMVARINVEKQQGACFRYITNDNEDGFYIECEKCGEVTKMECHQLAELYHHVSEDHHFSINPQRTVFYGRCEKCKK
jgi:Fur family ferric uptake transcriptional regulator